MSISLIIVDGYMSVYICPKSSLLCICIIPQNLFKKSVTVNSLYPLPHTFTHTGEGYRIGEWKKTNSSFN
jgi:hypothetical protein